MDWLYFDLEAVGVWTRSTPEEFARWHDGRAPAIEADRVPCLGHDSSWRRPWRNTRQMDALLGDLELLGSPYRLREPELPQLVRFNASLTPENGPNGFWGLFRGAGVATMLVEPPKSGVKTWRWEAVRMPVYRNASTWDFRRWYARNMEWPQCVGIAGHLSRVSETSLEVLPLMIRYPWGK